MSATESQLHRLLQANLEGFVLSLLVLFIGLAALGVHLMRLKRNDRTLLWFGLFLSLYGIRALGRNAIPHALFELPPPVWRYLDSIVSNVIITPALLFFEQVYGRGWKSGLRWLWWIQMAWGAVAIVADFAAGQPGRMPDPSNLLVVCLLPLLIAGLAGGYRPPQRAWAALIFAGGAIFLVSVIVDHLRDAGLTPWHMNIEPFGFLANLACLGYVAVKRFVGNEQQLIAIEEEMKAAARIQASILPRATPRLAGLDVAVRYLPMQAVAGDFYDFLTPGDGGLGILLADVTGHGVPAALVASMVKVGVWGQAENAADPARVIAGLNQLLCRQVQGQFTTAGYLYLDPGKGLANYAAAGHPPLLLWRGADRTLREFRENGLLMGVRAGESYVSVPIELTPGDRLLLYTDGITEAANEAGEFFGEERLGEFISAHAEMPAETFAAKLVDRLTQWSGGSRRSQGDDISLVVVDVSAQFAR